MLQSRLASLIEAAINTLIGFAISFMAWPIAAAATGITYNTAQHWGVVGFFTAISVARGYIIRRWFNTRLHKTALKIAERVG
ncbi:MAG: hypothetical protein ABJM39_11755 [Porticoccus sp.]|uniref:DUF7220 family protein n=1 Tax=Porticoccus sp. TaxID=2024853 RepID=UPI003297E430